MSLFAIHIVKAHGTGLELWILNTELGQSLFNKTAHFASLADAREVAFHVGHEAGYSRLTESFGHDLQGDRFARTGGTGDKTMAVGHFSFDRKRSISAMGDIDRKSVV